MIHLIITCVISEIYAYSIIKEIVKLEEENQKLNEEIVTELKFELSDLKKFERYGETCKYLLKDRDSNDSWLFKIYASSVPVNSTIVTYRLAQLLGIDISEITKTALLINKRRKYGSIQKIIPKVRHIEEIPFSELSSKQIECMMKNQVLDWLVFNSDVDGDEFLTEEETGKIIAIDKDETFYDYESTLLTDNQGGDSYYCKFWEAYLKKKFDVDKVNFKKIFKLIDYFQGINDKYIICIINDLLKDIMDFSQLDSIIKTVISRKHNLRIDFENFYKNLVEARDSFFQLPPIDKKNTYAQIVLERLKESVSQKKAKLAQLKLKESGKQESIKRISCSDAWYLVEELNYASRKEFFSLSGQTIKKLSYLRGKVPSIYEQFVIDLYIEQIRSLQRKKGIENFISWEINRIILYPEQMTSSKISNIEYNLRTIYGEVRKEFSEYRKDIEKNPRDILLHLNYIQYPIGRSRNEEELLILKEYEEWLKKNLTDLIYQVLYGIILGDKKYLEGINDNFAWKYLGMGLINSYRERKNSAIEECKKALLCNNGKETDYCTYMLLGLLHEYNSSWEKFGEGFKAEESIMAYKKAVIINPKSVNAHLNLGILYLTMEEPDKALSEFKEVNKLDPQYAKEHFYFDRIKPKITYKDEKEYLKAVRMNTLSGRHNYIMGLGYLIKGDKELARKYFDKAREFGYVIKVQLQ